MRPRAALVLLLLAPACAGSAPTPSTMTSPLPRPAASAAPTAAANPILAPWTGPYGGVPPFGAVETRHVRPAIDAAIERRRTDVAAIAASSEPPTFEGVLVRLEDAARTFDRVTTVMHVLTSTMSTKELEAIERDVAPRLAALEDEITQNERLFARVQAVYEARDEAKLSTEQKRLAWRAYTRFVRAGAKLDAASKRRLTEINQRLAALYTAFKQAVLADEEGYVTVLDGEADLAGLPPSVRAAAAAAAEARGHAGKHAVVNTRSSVEPFLTYSTRRDLREKVFRNFASRGDHGDKNDTKASVTEILALRAERAKLLGYATHAHWRVEDQMAKTPERATLLMEAFWKPAVARAREEIADMQALARKEGAKDPIAAWDHRFYAEKVRKAKYDLEEDAVKPYLQLEKLREGMFWVAEQLFGFRFEPASNVPVYHPDVRVWEVKDAESGKHVGLWYFDPYARPGKRSGAWMNAYRDQERVHGDITTIVSNNSNFVKGKPGEPVLVSWEDARTLFHEFGHALHGLSSDVTYPSLAGTSVARDYVEFPSQLLEFWLATPEVLSRFAVHHQTGAPLPKELLAKIEKAATFNQGFATVEYLSSAIVDMKLHTAPAGTVDPAAFEKATLAALGMPDAIVMRHRTPHFAHAFTGDGYSAGYYSYLWADTLSSDAHEAFVEAGGPYDKTVAARLKKHVFSAGDTVDPDVGYRAFRGHDAGIEALMRKRGFAAKAPAAAKGAGARR